MKMTFEEENKLGNDIAALMLEHCGGENRHDLMYAGLWGMARAMLTPEQLITMKSYLERWLSEKAEEAKAS